MLEAHRMILCIFVNVADKRGSPIVAFARLIRTKTIDQMTPVRIAHPRKCPEILWGNRHAGEGYAEGSSAFQEAMSEGGHLLKKNLGEP